MDIVTMLPMMVDVILMEVIVVYKTKILNTVCFVFVMLKSQKVNELFLQKVLHVDITKLFLVCWVFGYQIGDEICDGIANTEACNYDDGDCCLEEIYKICYGDDCICHEDGLIHPEVFCN